MSDSTRSTFEEGDVVVLLADYDHFAYDTTDDRDQKEIAVEGCGPRARYEVTSIDYDRGFLYNLRLNGVQDEYDYIRVWNVSEGDIQKV